MVYCGVACYYPTVNFNSIIILNFKNKIIMKKTIYLKDNRRNRRRIQKGLQPQKQRCATIILMAVPLPIHTITAVLDMPKGNANRGVRAEEIINACAASTYVTVPPATITAIQLNLTNYNGATPSTRTNLWRILNNDMKSLMRLFQEAGDNDPENAIAIIESGAFRVKEVNIPQKHEFTVENSPVNGTVDLSAEGGGPQSCHDWMYSADNVTFERMRPTVIAETHKDGLPIGEFAYFTHEIVTSEGPQGVSQVIKIMVS
jgi:hypothetical protein